MNALTEQKTLTSDDIDSIYYIVNIKNLVSILKHGILSHNAARQQGVYQAKHDISDEGVQKIRHSKNFFSPRTHTKRKLHEYANAYLQPYNAMMMVIQKETSREELCVVRISRQILEDRKDEVVLTTKNAACHQAKFVAPQQWTLSPFSTKALTSTYLSGLPSKQWAGRLTFLKAKQSRQSEALFPGKIEPHYINAVYVYNEEVQERVQEMLQTSRLKKPVPEILISTSLFVSPVRGAFGKQLNLEEDQTNLSCKLDFTREESITTSEDDTDSEQPTKRARMYAT